MAAQSAQELRRHVEEIEGDLNENLTTSEMAAHEIAASSGRALEERVFQVACRVALRFGSRMHWSNFHTWEFFRNVHTSKEAREVAPRFWKSIYPFSTCLGMASTVTTALRASLLKEKGLSRYAELVQLATNCDIHEFKTSRRFHCLTMIRLVDYCIVIDLVAQPTAFKVNLTSVHQSQAQLRFLEKTTLSFEYAYVSGPNNARMLVEYSRPDTNASNSFTYEDPFTDVEEGIQGGIVNYAFPLAKSKRRMLLGDMPCRRTVQTRSIWNYRPRNGFITYTRLGRSKYLVDSLTLRIDIIEQQLVLQLPYSDWLATPQNLHFLERMQQYSGFKRCTESLQDAVAYFYLPLGTPGTMLDLPTNGLSLCTWRSVQLVDEVCTALGLPEGEVLRIVKVVADFWMGALCRHNEKLIRDEAWGRGTSRSCRLVYRG
ncbi:hypothetical protein N0V83_005951 [Neocucurbitaria cava]|uniref:Uncharacterized protein n=1 Tax=Neocucurbitaria cava TaxID=798079 RepID=A0A9W8Y712_9PLEO|nr:hypothetical protein N0V83_005951 [Neocucurbitaria cava]